MSEFYFSKAWLVYGKEIILVFKQGEIGKPICVLNKQDIEDLNKEWKRKREE